jgi:transposase-like protein
MAQPPVSDEQKREALEALHAAGGNRSEAARQLGLNLNTYRNRLRAAEMAPPGDSTPLNTRQEQRHRDNTERLKADLKEAHRHLNEMEDLRRVAFHLAAQPLDPPRWTVQKHKGKRQQETPVLFTSDFQWGEVVKADEMDGLNEYSIDIATRRYQQLIDKTIDLCFNHTANPSYPGIIYLRGGDAISGGIHDELMETDELKPNPCIQSLAAQEIAGIQRLADAFGKVHVVSVPGNHGRQTKKPRAKQYVDTNAEGLLAWVIEMHILASGDKRITFNTPRSGDAYFNVGDTRFLLTHGDRLGSRGGQGFIGPAATILRGVYKTRQQYHQIGKHIDYVLLGHYHVAMFLARAIVNGSLIGFNEYARQLRVEPEPASQWLFHVHPEIGITQSRQIFVS